MSSLIFEPLDKKKCEPCHDGVALPYDKFAQDKSPLFKDVSIKEIWGFYDGPLFGICEIRGESLFFFDVVSDIWRYYDRMFHSKKIQNGYHQDCDRMGPIFAVSDVPIKKIKKVIRKTKDRRKWQDFLEDEYNMIGIFIDYTREDNFLKNTKKDYGKRRKQLE